MRGQSHYVLQVSIVALLREMVIAKTICSLHRSLSSNQRNASSCIRH